MFFSIDWSTSSYLPSAILALFVSIDFWCEKSVINIATIVFIVAVRKTSIALDHCACQNTSRLRLKELMVIVENTYSMLEPKVFQRDIGSSDGSLRLLV
ncbi:hypothetical protein AX774_g6921 [Zancudomyces culisetae]|uniref:Uncharacterized protein n=1 Tax=Zancudomyces culisetae TaxID=1213189 RepID=A0A1R1PFG5_ZANCU|nr:hypothetical protein AX774_g6921 [Zancudomyces culisetae]|eukprot:OMH79658.1 hypothetical protein AX774_g6921 [Zancudomyces culisetae]